MREALARSDHDFVLTAPARSRRPAKKSSGGVGQFGAALMRRPGRTLAVVVFAGMLCGVVANALFFQTARHPAPIFRGPVTAARPAHLPAVQPPAAQITAPTTAPVPMPPQRGVDKAAAPQAPVATRTEATNKDQIGALLSGGAAATSTSANDAARVAAAQKALVKLGYVVKADGVMGSGTRKAIEMFEQSRKLPTTGELTPRVTRELSALSGVAVP